MPKVVISSDKGLVQKSGTTVLHQVTNKGSQDGKFGLYTYVREIDFVKGGATGGGYTATTTDDGLVARLCSVPANTHILNMSVQLTEAFTGGLASTGVISLGHDADSDVVSGADVTSETDLVASIDVSGVAGSVVGCLQAAGGTTVGATKLELCLYNNGNNTAGACTTGKLLFIMQCLASAAPVDLAQKF
jgi:hypothetical protein